jgi:competence protein ComEA
VDGERIQVPRPGEKLPADALGTGTVAGTGSGSGLPGAIGASGGTGQGQSGAPVDLNAATMAQLDALPGVGPVIAGRIVAWREQNGRFARVEDLTEVQGIGEATFARLRSLVRV